jgi:L-amino acid N-acyltransferase
MIVREAAIEDMAAIADIVNATTLTTTAAWTETLETVDLRLAWFASQAEAGYPILVADDGGVVVGFASYGDFRDSKKWPGYRFTVEHSIHVRESHWGAGVGRSLLEALIDCARRQGKHVIIAAVDGANEASVRFHARLGFVEVARMPETGFKFGRWLDLVLMQRLLTDEMS